MAPAARPDVRKPVRRSSISKSQSQEGSQNPKESPSSKSHSSGGGGSRSHRRRKSSPTTKSALRETLSSFGDDVIKIKNYPRLYGYDNHGYFQPDISFDVSSYRAQDSTELNEKSPQHEGEEPVVSILGKGMAENELATIMSTHDPNFRTKHFERVNPSEVGVRSTRWQKLFQTSAASRRFQKFKRISKRKSRSDDWPSPHDDEGILEDFYNRDGQINRNPLYWGISRPTRDKISILGLSLILHELACFTSCVLLGCTLFRGIEAISWTRQKPFTDNWFCFKCYSSFQTLLIVITCFGFLNRVDTTQRRSLWILPLFLIPVLCLSVSDYCNKAWELQRIECINFYRLDEVAKQRTHLSQDCSHILKSLSQIHTKKLNMTAKSIPRATSIAGQIQLQNVAGPVPKVNTEPLQALPSKRSLTISELDTRGAAPLVMRIISALSTLVISIYLFCCRKTYFLTDIFGPPEELPGNIEMVTLNRKRRSNDYGTVTQSEDPNNISKRVDTNEDFDVIFQRGRQHP